MQVSAMRMLAALGAAMAMMIAGFTVIAIGHIDDGLGPVATMMVAALTGAAVLGFWRPRE